MKLRSILTILVLSFMFTGCRVAETENESSSISNNTIEETEVKDENIDLGLKLQDENLEIVDINEEIYTLDEVEPNNLMDNLTFIVDVIHLDYETDEILGNTATLDGYSGTLVIHMIDLDDRGIEVGKTYVIETLPMISMTNPPDVTAVEITEATDTDIEELESIREEISNYAECMYEYNNMEPADIIEHANMEYGKWTQWEILKYLDFLDELGYNEGNKVRLKQNIQDLESEEETDGVIEITYIAE